MPTVNKNGLVHVVLAHSYLFYFAGLLAGFIIDMEWGYVFSPIKADGIGLILLIAGPLLISWAQSTSRRTKVHRHGKDVMHNHISQGPYAFIRSPTNLGIGIMMLGLALVFQSVPLIITTVISFFITRYIFIRQEERLLLEKYGAPYKEYRKRVHF